MGLPNEVNSALIGAAAAGDVYEIEQSLRFSGDEFISRANPTNTATSRKTFTHSFWVKRGSLGSTQQLAYWVQGGAAQQTFIAFDSSDRINVFYEGSAGAAVGHSYSTSRYRDASAWYHIVWATDTTQATSTNRWKVWVNGEQITTWDSVAYPSQDLILPTNDTGRGFAHGARYGNEDQRLSGYIAESHFVDGQFLDHEDFGKYDNNGVWRPIAYSGTYGVRGWYLPFDVADIYSDESGNNQDFAPFTGYVHDTSGIDTDVLSDTPTNNFCTWNPNSSTAGSTSNGNLTGSLSGRKCGTLGVSSGKWYWECKYIPGNSFAVGQGAIVVSSGDPVDAFGNGVVWYSGVSDGRYGSDYGVYVMGSFSNYGGTWWTGTNTFGMALDLDSAQNTMTFYRNGTSYGAVNIPSGHTWAPVYSSGSGFSSGSFTLYIDENTWTYTPPTGFDNALNTANLPTPSLKDGSDYFQTVLYQGNDPTGQNITVADNSGNSWQPDFVWIKARGVQYWHRLYDAVRGATKELYSNDGSSEDTDTNALTSFNSNGFTLGSDQGVNQNTYNFVSWNWKAGNGTSSIAAGSIDGTNPTIASTVSVNPTAGFSIVSWSATLNSTSANTATIGHGLGVAPDMIIQRPRNTSSTWQVYHSALGTGNLLMLNNTNAVQTAAGCYPSVTSTVWTPGDQNYSGGTYDYINYCFAEVEGYSKFGKYTGTGGQQFVYLGFSPEFVMIKRTDASSDVYSWFMFDATRDPINNNANEPMIANKAFEEGRLPDGGSGSIGNIDFDFLSNGFGFPSYQGSGINASGATMVYAAFAKNPFGGDGVSPATAR